MHGRARLLACCAAAAAFVCIAPPSAAHADAAWTCSAATGWVGTAAQRADAPRIGATPCPQAQAESGSAGAPAGSLASTGTLTVDGGSESQTIDSRKPQTTFRAKSLVIRSADGKLVLNASGVDLSATGSCDSNRQPVFTSSASFGSVSLNNKQLDTTREYSEPGVGVNGAPLFGKITVRFGETEKTDSGISRSGIHLIVADRNGAVVFEALAGAVSTGRDGAVCDPPPLCPPGQEPRAGRCVDVIVTPLPTPPSPPGTPAPLPGPAPPGATPPPAARGCRDALADIARVSTTRLANATLCLLNTERKRRHLAALRSSLDLTRAARRHARDMVKRHYFSHTAPSGTDVTTRVRHSGYLDRFGRWRIGENLGWGWGQPGTPRAIVAAWMRSPPHRRNIVGRKFRDVGIAVTRGSPRLRRSVGVTYVIDFGGFSRY